MSTYITEEEQLEAIKAFFKKYQTVILTVLVAFFLLVAGYRYWSWHHTKQLSHASIIYEQMMQAFLSEDDVRLQAYTKQLMDEDAKTVYQDIAYLVKANQAVSKQQWDEALRSLSVVIKQTKMSALKTEALFRSARILCFLGRAPLASETLKQINDPIYDLRKRELVCTQ